MDHEVPLSQTAGCKYISNYIQVAPVLPIGNLNRLIPVAIATWRCTVVGSLWYTTSLWDGWQLMCRGVAKSVGQDKWFSPCKCLGRWWNFVPKLVSTYFGWLFKFKSELVLVMSSLMTTSASSSINLKINPDEQNDPSSINHHIR